MQDDTVDIIQQTMRDREDPLDALLSLEEQYYAEGYTLGLADGNRSGRAQGRALGLEKGFEKFAEMGRMNGKAALWQGRTRMSLEDQHSWEIRQVPPLAGVKDYNDI